MQSSSDMNPTDRRYPPPPPSPPLSVKTCCPRTSPEIQLYRDLWSQLDEEIHKGRLGQDDSQESQKWLWKELCIRLEKIRLERDAMRRRMRNKGAGPEEPTGTQAGPEELTGAEAGPGEPTGKQAGPEEPTGKEAGPEELTEEEAGPEELLVSADPEGWPRRLARSTDELLALAIFGADHGCRTSVENPYCSTLLSHDRVLQLMEAGPEELTGEEAGPEEPTGNVQEANNQWIKCERHCSRICAQS